MEAAPPPKKRCRSKNFSVSEISILTEEMKVHLPFLRSKYCGTTVTKKLQDSVWQRIRAKVNSAGVSVRTMEEVREKWRNLQRKAKSDYTAERISLVKTGGGPPPAETNHGEIIDMMKDKPSFSGVAGAANCESFVFDFVSQNEVLDSVESKASSRTFLSLDAELPIFVADTPVEAASTSFEQLNPTVSFCQLPAHTPVRLEEQGISEETDKNIPVSGRAAEETRPCAQNGAKQPKRTIKELQAAYFEGELLLQSKKEALLVQQTESSQLQVETLKKLNLLLDNWLNPK